MKDNETFTNKSTDTMQDYKITRVIPGEINIDLTENELSFLMDMAGNTIHRVDLLRQIPYFLWSAQDCEDAYFHKWGLDKANMLAKLKTLTQADQQQIVFKSLEHMGEGVFTDGRIYTSGISLYGFLTQDELPDEMLS